MSGETECDCGGVYRSRIEGVRLDAPARLFICSYVDRGADSKTSSPI
jgi:hypothetical protein